MIPLIRYFVLKAALRRIWLFGLIPIAVCILWRTLPERSGRFAAGYAILFGALLPATIMAVNAAFGKEFDLTLPFRRRTLSMARNTATLLFLALAAMPVIAGAVGIAALDGRHGEMLLYCVTLFAGWAAIVLMAVPLTRLMEGLSPLLAVPMTVLLWGGMVVLFVAGPLILRKPSMLTAALAVVAGALGWALDVWQVEDLELAPGSETGILRFGGMAVTGSTPLQAEEDRAIGPTSSPRPGLLDGFSPLVRIMSRTVWFRWWYPLLIVFVAFFVPHAAPRFHWAWIYPVGMLLWIFRRTTGGLLPFVRRQTIFRCVVAPFVAAPLLVVCAEAFLTDSSERIVAGLTSVLTMSFSGWVLLRSAREYARPAFSYVRQCVWLLPLLSMFLPRSPRISAAVTRLSASLTTDLAPWLFGNPWLLSAAMVLAIALLWWRCERKFMHYEPAAAPAP